VGFKLWNGVMATITQYAREIQFMLDQVMNSMIESTWLKLIMVIDHNHCALAKVIRNEVWHRSSSLSFLFLAILPDLGLINGLFYSLNGQNHRIKKAEGGTTGGFFTRVHFFVIPYCLIAKGRFCL
jgi:hypothetical protein